MHLNRYARRRQPFCHHKPGGARADDDDGAGRIGLKDGRGDHTMGLKGSRRGRRVCGADREMSARAAQLSGRRQNCHAYSTTLPLRGPVCPTGLASPPYYAVATGPAGRRYEIRPFSRFRPFRRYSPGVSSLPRSGGEGDREAVEGLFTAPVPAVRNPSVTAQIRRATSPLLRNREEKTAPPQTIQPIQTIFYTSAARHDYAMPDNPFAVPHELCCAALQGRPSAAI